MNETKYPPPEAFGITQVKRGDLILVEVSTGFFFYHNPTSQTRWLSDGVDMFYNHNHEAISPGTMEWWFVAYEWLEDEDELMEAYFPEMTRDV